MTTENLDLENIDLDDESVGPKALRDALKAQKAAKAAMEQELASLRAEKRKADVEVVIKTKGLDPKVAEIIPSDADPAEWLEKYGDVFGGKAAEQAGATQSTEAEPAKQEPREEHPLEGQFGAMQAAQDGAQAPANVGFDLTRAEAALEEGGLEGFENFFRSGGGAARA
jgi:hypothetical protein